MAADRSAGWPLDKESFQADYQRWHVREKSNRGANHPVHAPPASLEVRWLGTCDGSSPQNSDFARSGASRIILCHSGPPGTRIKMVRRVKQHRIAAGIGEKNVLNNEE